MAKKTAKKPKKFKESDGSEPISAGEAERQIEEGLRAAGCSRTRNKSNADEIHITGAGLEGQSVVRVRTSSLTRSTVATALQVALA